jgi:DNA-binding IclR family transcriptional regulator
MVKKNKSAIHKIPSSSVRSIERCIDILDLLVAHDRAMSLTELAGEMRAPKSTVLTILRTLVGRGLVAVDPRTKVYRTGLGFTRYAASAQIEVDLHDLAMPHLETLVEDTRETVTLALTDGLSVFYRCRIMGSLPLQYVIPVGMPRPMHATAGGKILLAHMAHSERLAYYRSVGLAKYTERTITVEVKLEAELAKFREAGFATACGETSGDLFGVAAPVFDREGKAVAAVNLGGPLTRFKARREIYVKAVLAAAAQISTELRRIGRDFNVQKT